MKKLKILIILLITIVSFSYTVFTKVNPISFINSTVIAEDEEDEDEEDEHEDEEDEDEHREEDEDDRDEDRYYAPQDITPTPNINEFVPTKEPQTKITTIEYKEILTTTYVQVTEDAYKNDRDGDKLVDAIDPNPDIPQQQFFTDSDGDGVPDAEDKFLGRNDFLYFGNEDLNNNGVVDLYELY